MRYLLLLVLFVLSPIANAKDVGSVTGLPLPRFVALKANETNLRRGPNLKYPIAWTYKVKGYPMEIVAEFENWRKLRDSDGEEGWVHESLVSGNRNVMIVANSYLKPKAEYEERKKELLIFRYPDESSYPMARVELGNIAKVKKCELDWCKLKIDDYIGWVRKENLWGVYRNESFE